MTSLFSSFDLMIFYFSYIMLSFFICVMFTVVYKHSSLSILLSFFTNKIFSKFFYTLKPLGFTKTFISIILSSFIFISFMNFFSVFSYSFPSNSSFGNVLFMSLFFWLSFFVFSLVFNLKGFLSHLIPEGTPIFLTMFLFLIEILSNTIRPLTLTVRLVANILAGHLLMVLLSKLVFIFNLSFLGYIMLNLVEVAVGFIQAYILCTLVTLYFSEME